jgi:hypothetical protein
VAGNRVFTRIFGDRRRDGKKPGFFGERVPETGFLREYLVTVGSRKKPGFFGARVARNRVFARIFGNSPRFGKKPGFFGF